MLQNYKMDCSLAILYDIHNKQETFLLLKSFFLNTPETF